MLTSVSDGDKISWLDERMSYIGTETKNYRYWDCNMKIIENCHCMLMQNNFGFSKPTSTKVL